MTTLNLDDNSATYQIRGYRPGLIQINDKEYTHSLIIAPSQLIENWPPATINELTPATLSIIIELKPDILLIGTGSTMALLPVDLYGDLINHGIGVEIMSTGAACRTYNALTAENRNVIAALIL